MIVSVGGHKRLEYCSVGGHKMLEECLSWTEDLRG